MKNEVKGVYNISSAKKIRLTEIAKIISKHYKKIITFESKVKLLKSKKGICETELFELKK